MVDVGTMVAFSSVLWHGAYGTPQVRTVGDAPLLLGMAWSHIERSWGNLVFGLCVHRMPSTLYMRLCDGIFFSGLVSPSPMPGMF